MISIRGLFSSKLSLKIVIAFSSVLEYIDVHSGLYWIYGQICHSKVGTEVISGVYEREIPYFHLNLVPVGTYLYIDNWSI